MLHARLHAMEERVVCPSPEQLEYSGPVQCPVEGCGKELASSACLRMHLARRHHGKPLEKAQGSPGNVGRRVTFYCPVSGCNRSREGGEPFLRLGQLKQHYQTIHGQKNYACSLCGRKFALRDMCNRHQRQECQQKIVCSTCGLDFRSRNALYQHAKRKGHTLPSRGKKASNSVPPMNVVLVPIPTSIKVVIPVPKNRKMVSSSTQTEETYFHESQSMPVLLSPVPEVELQSSSSQTMPEPQTPPTFNHTHLFCSPSDFLSLGTQTNSPLTGDEAATTSVPPVVSTQTPTTQLCNFGTQTGAVDINHTFLFASNSSGSNSSCYSNHCCPTLNLVEFGTQTTSEQYGIGESDTADFGTQTSGMSGLEMDDPLFSRHFLPPECLDFGTQTLDCSYGCVSHSVQTCVHSKDQCSQT